MSLLKSRPLMKPATGFESLQLGESLTFAEESLRKALSHINNGGKVEWVRREIILPVKKNRPVPVPQDHSGHILQGQLVNAIGRRYWHKLSEQQRNEMSRIESSAYFAEDYDDFDSRVVFFRGLMSIQMNSETRLINIITAVKVYSLSVRWDLAEVRFWESTACPNINAPHQYRGAELLVMTTVTIQSPLKELRPPSFLL